MEIIFFQKIKNDGGPKSFQKKFIRWFYSKNINFSFLSYKNFFKKKYLFINAGSLKLVTVLLQKILKVADIGKFFHQLRQNQFHHDQQS